MQGLYTIEDFNSERGQERGMYGFSIILAQPVAEAIIKAEKRDETCLLFTMLQDRLNNSVETCDRRYACLSFHEDTWLLRSIVVGGQCACFTFSRPIGGSVRYSPHNIDSREQAAAILSTWLLWFNHVITLTDFTQPYGF